MIDTLMQQDLGRAKNALQNYLIRKLLIPKVYLDAEFNGVQIDVLAIDRAGVGDVHAVLMVLDDHNGEEIIWKVLDYVRRFRSFPSHYRYVAAVCGPPNPRKAHECCEESAIRESLAEDGVGRVGILYVDMTEDDPKVQVLLKAERFRSSQQIIELADRFVAEHTANWEVRE
ncbi:MAG: hypothetical protein ABSC47_06060 [Terracidiphilus sp.]|jgi:hypothetical protein